MHIYGTCALAVVNQTPQTVVFEYHALGPVVDDLISGCDLENDAVSWCNLAGPPVTFSFVVLFFPSYGYTQRHCPLGSPKLGSRRVCNRQSSDLCAYPRLCNLPQSICALLCACGRE